MVTFTCQNCNSSLKKKNVETHLYKCRSPVLTCIDCLKDFDESSYGAHVTCITENEKYGGKGFIPTASMQKQKQWNDCVASVLQSGHLKPQSLKEIVKFASNYPTCPRNKKKFINFCLNNKPFLKYRSSVETAFGLINDEFVKKYGNTNDNEDGQTKVAGEEEDRSAGGGKRKTISETQDEVVANGDEPVEQTTEKLLKKKNKKNSKHEAKTNGHTEENGVETQENEKKTKNKGKLNSSCEGGPVDTNADSPSSEKKKKKKKNKDKKNISIEEPDTSSQMPADKEEDEPPSLNAIDINADEANADVVNGVATVNGTKGKLSKKEKKKLLKDKKYKAEIESIENYQKDEETTEQVTDETTQPDKTKKKKKKHLEEEAQQASRESKRSISEPDDKKIKLEGETVEEESPPAQKPKKFKWDQIIVEVLQGSNDQEMSLKRLSKKVCGEYVNVYGERESYEDILLKFNKKVVKTPGVRVFKDKAKLLIDS